MDTKSGALDFQDGATWPSGLSPSAGRPRLAGVAGAAGARWPPLKPVVPAIWSALTRPSHLDRPFPYQPGSPSGPLRMMFCHRISSFS